MQQRMMNGHQDGRRFSQSPVFRTPTGARGWYRNQGSGPAQRFSSAPLPSQRAPATPRFSNSPRGNRTFDAQDDRTPRINVKMDVPHIFHPYMIGPSGRKSQELMNNSQVLVHYNDSNCRCPTWPKMNTVTIDGRVKNVEAARSELRDRMPLTIWINTTILDDPQAQLEMIAKGFADRNLSSVNRVCFGEVDKESPHIRTELHYAGPVTAICDREIAISGKSDSDALYTAEIPVLSLINPWNIELSQILVDYVEAKSGCRILYPPKESFSGEPPAYYIKGNTMEGMMFAIRHLFGFSMIEMTFLLHSNTFHIDNARIESWEREFGVYVVAHRTESKFMAVSLFSLEFNLNNVYRVYASILGYMVPIRTHDYTFMEDAISMLPMDVFVSCKLFFLLGGTDKCGGGADDDFTNRCFYRQYYGNPDANVFARQNIDRNLSMLLMHLVNGYYYFEDPRIEVFKQVRSLSL